MRMPSLLALPLMAAGLAFAAPVPAQDEGGDIVVRGDRDPGDVRAAVQAMAGPLRADEAPVRFMDPLCLSVSGLVDEHNEYIRRRMAGHAEAAGIALAGANCRANALVLIVNDPQKVIDEIEDKQPKLISREESYTIKAALDAREKAIVWHNEEQRSAEGARLAMGSAIAGTKGSHIFMGAETRINTNTWPRRDRLMASRAVLNGVVLLDARELAGVDVARIADYATMRLLAPVLVPPEDAEALPDSVTVRFPDADGALRLTRFDEAYLAALYGLEPDAPAHRLPAAVARAYGEVRQ